MQRRASQVSWIFVAVLVAAVLPVRAENVQPGSRAGLDAVHAYLRRQAVSDTGTLHLFVYNSALVPIEVTAAEISIANPTTLDSLQSLLAEAQADSQPAQECLWWMATPNPVPPGGFADVVAKLASPPSRKMHLAIRCSNGSFLEQDFLRINDGLAFSFIGFSPDIDCVYLYVENCTTTPVPIRQVEINGRDVTGQARCLWPVIPPDGKTCIVVPLAEPLKPGAFVFARVHGDREPAVCASLTRAFSSFPITWLDGSLPAGLEGTADSSEPYRIGSVPGEGLPGIENILRCPAHAHGSRQDAAKQFIRGYQTLLRAEPQVPGMIYVCRWEKEVNYFAFGELGDFVRIMPFAKSFSYEPARLNHSVQWLTNLGMRAAAPRPVHADIPIRFADSYQWSRSCTPREVQAMIYLPLSRGVKGLSYGEKRPGIAPESATMLADVTRQVVRLRPYLSYADTFPIGKTSDPDVEAACLLAGDTGLVLLVINHTLSEFSHDKPLQDQPKHDIQSTLSLPQGLIVESIIDVASPSSIVKWDMDGARLVVHTPVLDVAQPYLIHFSGRHLSSVPSTRPVKRGG